jgi:hypothetical protein
MTDTVSHEPAPKTNLLEDFIDLFGSPSTVFTRRVNAGALGPFLLTCALLISLSLVNRGVISNVMEAATAKKTQEALQSGKVTQAQIDQGAAIQKKILGLLPVLTAVFLPVTLVVFALCAWLVGKAFGSTLTFGGALMICSFAWVPRAVEQVLLSVQVIFIDPSTITSMSQVNLGVARFLDHATTSPKLLALTGRIDPFSLWSSALLALGFIAVGKLEKGKGWAAAGALWVLATLVAVAQA